MKDEAASGKRVYLGGDDGDVCGDKESDGGDSMMSVMNGLQMFDAFDEEAKEELVAQMKIERFEIGETIMKQGEKGDHLYVILRGTANVLIDQENAPPNGSG
jgi:CRP-like cAMP-binding protein